MKYHEAVDCGGKGNMERLTFEVHDGGIFVKESDVKTFTVEDEIMHTGNAIRKLAEYEDLQNKLNKQFEGCIDIEMFVDSIIEYDKLFSRDEKLADALMLTNDDVRKYREWKSLDKQGKLLKLPCAVGDTVYHICTFKVGETEIIEMRVGCVEPCGAIRSNKGVCEVWNVYAEMDYTKEYFKFFDFGKTVFLTREEAEAALKEL